MGEIVTQAGNASPARRVDMPALERLCERGLEAVGYQLVDLEHVREQSGWVLRVFVDHLGSAPVERGVEPRRITHEDCMRVSRHLGTVLEVEDAIREAYNLEVSSPGVFRRLRKGQDFARFSGFQVKVKLRQPIEGRRNFAGVIEDAADTTVTIGDGEQRWTLPLDNIHRAQLAEEY